MRWLLLLLALMVGVAQSQEAAKSQPKAQKTAQKRTADQRGTESQPLVVKAQEAEKTPERVEQDRHENEEKADRESRLVLWTFALAVLTGVLALIAGGQLVMFWIQLKLMTQATKDAGIAAKAAQYSADAAKWEFIASHRPKLILRDATTEQDMEELIVVKYILSNIGGTPATIVAGALRVNVFKGWQFGPENLPEIGGEESDIDSITLKSGEQVSLSFTSPTLRWSDKNDTCHEFLEPEYGMFFSGQIVYEGRDGVRRHTGFRRKYFSNQHRFLCIDSGAHYEYQD